MPRARRTRSVPEQRHTAVLVRRPGSVVEQQSVLARPAQHKHVLARGCPRLLRRGPRGWGLSRRLATFQRGSLWSAGVRRPPIGPPRPLGAEALPISFRVTSLSHQWEQPPSASEGLRGKHATVGMLASRGVIGAADGGRRAVGGRVGRLAGRGARSSGKRADKRRPGQGAAGAVELCHRFPGSVT
jgi:hypothetical protein